MTTSSSFSSSVIQVHTLAARLRVIRLPPQLGNHEPVSTPTPFSPVSASPAWLLRRGAAAGHRRVSTRELPRRSCSAIACSLTLRAIPPSHRAQRMVLNSKLREQGLARVASFCDFPTTPSPPASSRRSESTSRSEPSSKRVRLSRAPPQRFRTLGVEPSGQACYRENL